MYLQLDGFSLFPLIEIEFWHKILRYVVVRLGYVAIISLCGGWSSFCGS